MIIVRVSQTMNDPIHKTPDGSLYRTTHELYPECLVRNILRIYEWEPVPEQSLEGAVNTTLEEEGYQLVGEAIMKAPPPAILGDGTESEWITNDTGGFTRAPCDNEYVRETHRALAAWEHWVPETAQQRRYRDMVVRLEARSRHEEDERAYAEGTSVRDI